MPHGAPPSAAPTHSPPKRCRSLHRTTLAYCSHYHACARDGLSAAYARAHTRVRDWAPPPRLPTERSRVACGSDMWVNDSGVCSLIMMHHATSCPPITADYYTHDMCEARPKYKYSLVFLPVPVFVLHVGRSLHARARSSQALRARTWGTTLDDNAQPAGRHVVVEKAPTGAHWRMHACSPPTRAAKHSCSPPPFKHSRCKCIAAPRGCPNPSTSQNQ